MYESARTLQAICFDFICTNFLEMCEVCDAHDKDSPCWDPDCFCILGLPEQRVRFKYFKTNYHVTLPSKISEPILASISGKVLLCDRLMTLFGSETTTLKHVILKDTSHLSMKGLMILKQHDIVDLEVNSLRITINDLITCLNDWSLQNLRSLSVAQHYCKSPSVNSFLALSNFPALQALNVSATKFNRHDLAMVVENLTHLESIDISCTLVDDITPLKKCKDRLKTLVMRNLKINTYKNAQDVFLELNELCTLDISVERDRTDGLLESTATDFLRAVDTMPHLTSLDISGSYEINELHLSKFIQAHPRLSYLGLIQTNADKMESLKNPSDPDYRPDLRVGGTSSGIQMIESLKRYSDRPAYLKDCFKVMTIFLKTFKEKDADFIKLVIPIMQLYPRDIRIQGDAVDCLCYLTREKRASRIHPSILQQAVDVILKAMDYFQSRTIHRDGLITISNYRVLRTVTFDKVRCASQVTKSLCVFSDPTVDKLSLNIFTGLLSTMSISEMSKVGPSSEVVRKLLLFIKTVADDEYEYNNMELAMRGLRDLTNESREFCSSFLFHQGGMKIYLEVLKRFPEDPSVNMIGLFNNIAEFSEMRQHLMDPKFMKMLPLLMECKRIGVSYHAAGVAAHLLSDGPQMWTDDPSMPTKTQILDQLAKTVKNWEVPEYEIVTYRSFKPLLPLLRATEPYPVQLWAAWAIYHACRTNPKRYCGMLTSENGIEILKSLEEDSENGTQPDVRTLCRSILDILELPSIVKTFVMLLTVT